MAENFIEFFEENVIVPPIDSDEGNEADVDVEKHENERFSVPEAYARVDPRTMMVHVQDANIAS